MKASRDVTKVINFCLDNLCPPILRDCYPLMFPIYWLAYGKQTAKLMKYKDNYPLLTEAEYAAYYELAGKADLNNRPTDLNQKGIQYILKSLENSDSVLDAGCGRGYLAWLLADKGYMVTGVDINPPQSREGERAQFLASSVDHMPFADHSFDTVICAHVLEHVPSFENAVSELLRVAKRQVLIVLPRQREYRYTADLHVRYFPYAYSVRARLPQSARKADIRLIGGDWAVRISIEQLAQEANDANLF